MSLPKTTRKLHRIGAIVSLLPAFVIIASGIVLQLKKEVAWIQPSTRRGSTQELQISFDRVLEVARNVPEAEVDSWADVDRLDVRPEKGMLKVRAKNRWEVQVDAATGDVLQVAYRRSDLVESIHDGSFFHDAAKLWVWLPAGILLFVLWLSGLYLWLLPHQVRRRRKFKRGTA